MEKVDRFFGPRWRSPHRWCSASTTCSRAWAKGPAGTPRRGLATSSGRSTSTGTEISPRTSSSRAARKTRWLLICYQNIFFFICQEMMELLNSLFASITGGSEDQTRNCLDTCYLYQMIRWYLRSALLNMLLCMVILDCDESNTDSNRKNCNVYSISSSQWYSVQLSS